MSNIITTERKTHISQVISRICNSNDGLILLKYLQEDYLLKCPFDENDVYKTHIRMGEQKIVKNLISLVKDHSKLSRIQTIQNNFKKGAVRNVR